MRLFNRKSEFKNNFIDIDYTSPEFYAGMYYIKKDEKNFIENFINYFLFEKEKQRKNQKLNKYFIKLIMKKHTLSDEDFISIVKNFRIIVENFCDLFEIGSENISISILSAGSGCFSINLGINIQNNNFNLVNLSDTSKNLVFDIVKKLTGKVVDEYDNFMSLFKDCITGYLTRKIDSNDAQMNYIDIKKSREAKRVIYKTIQKQQGIESVSFNGELVLASEMDVVV